MSRPPLVARWSLAAPSGLPRGTITTLMRSSTGCSRPCASSRAITSKASLPAGSSPCCWPTSSTVGLPADCSTAASVPPARVSTSASSVSPRCERPKDSTLARTPGVREAAAAWSRSQAWISAWVVKLVRPACSPGCCRPPEARESGRQPRRCKGHRPGRQARMAMWLEPRASPARRLAEPQGRRKRAPVQRWRAGPTAASTGATEPRCRKRPAKPAAPAGRAGPNGECGGYARRGAVSLGFAAWWSSWVSAPRAWPGAMDGLPMLPALPLVVCRLLPTPRRRGDFAYSYMTPPARPTPEWSGPS
jgi:hypothetical protein